MLKTSLPGILLRSANWAKSLGVPCSSSSLYARFASSHLPYEEQGQTQHSFSGNTFDSNTNNYRARQSGGYGGNRSGGYRGGYGGGREGYGGDRSKVSGFRGGKDRMNLRLLPMGNFDNLQPIQKNLYKEHQNVTTRSQSEIDNYLTSNQVTLRGQDIPRPILQFEEANFPEPIFRLLRNFSAPTVIQSISWPLALSGRDIISIAKTGSGKTLGFMLPAIMHTLSQPKRAPGEGPSVLVVLPTRELAQQVEQVARAFCSSMNLSVTCCFGGASRGPQLGMLSRGVDMVVGTPGRLIDFIDAGNLDLRRCSYLVLDEADRMLDMGFEPQIRNIVRQIRPDKQTLMFSATWPREIRQLATDFQKDAVFLNVGSLELSANANIKQHVEILNDTDKMSRLNSLMQEIQKEKDHKTLIFVQTKRAADMLTNNMRRNNISALALHGDKSQSERDWVMNEFRSGRAPILVATDIAARGIDVNDVKVVINYDYPNDAEDYVHRIGRTARADKKGISYTFFTPLNAMDKSNKAEGLIKVLEASKQEVPQELRDLAGGGYQQGQGNRRDRKSVV